MTRQIAAHLRFPQDNISLHQVCCGLVQQSAAALTYCARAREIAKSHARKKHSIRGLMRRYTDDRLTSDEVSVKRSVLRYSLQPTIIKLNEHILNMMDLLHQSLGATIDLATVLDGDLWVVRANASEIENAVLKLAINARCAMPKGGALIIETQNVCLTANDAYDQYGLTPGEYVRLSVSDTGRSMAPEVLARFEPFFAIKPVGRNNVPGLASVYEFIRQSGGNATIYSQPSRGTTVNLYLPRYEANERLASHPADRAARAY